MVWEKYGPSILGRAPVTPDIPKTGFRHAVWNNRMLIVALVGLGFIGWLYLWRGPYESQRSYIEQSITDGNARLDFWKWEKSYDKQTAEAFANGHLINDGKVSATKIRHLGVLIIADSPSLPEKQIFPVFLMLRAQLGINNSPEADIYPAQKSIWFSVWGPQISAADLKKMDDGKLYPIVMHLLRYTDQTVPDGKFIYTESCVILRKDNVVGLCNGNHNRTYISD
jgi:hypothetical protein